MGKITKIFPFLCIFCASVLDICLGVDNYETDVQDFNLTSIEIIRNYGYPAEVHKVQTEDGYILELHRIRHGKFSDSTHGVPILLVHGLLASSMEFLLLESNSLAFVLADAGHDVWMVNLRGSTYSMNHTSLNSSDTKFWDFSWHENGIYDIPSSIDYICKYTQNDRLLFIGYSMGTTAFFVTASVRPEYQEKLQGVILLGPTAYVKHTKSPLRVLAPFSKTVKGFYEFMGKGGVLEQTPELQNLLTVLCKPQFFCKNFLFMVAGRDSKGFENDVLPKALMHIPAGTSLKTAAHYGQLIMSGKFRQYDYGFIGNLKRYYQTKPPMYNLEAITSPLSLFVAPNDFFSTKKDLERLLQRLHSVKNIQVIPSPKFTHVDFVISKNLNEVFYPELLKELEHLMSYETVAKPIQKRHKANQNKAIPNTNYNQDHCSRTQITRANQDKIKYHPTDQITMNHRVVDRNRVVYYEHQYNSPDQIKYVYNIDNINYNPADYDTINQNKNAYSKADYNFIGQRKVMYHDVNPKKVIYNDGQYNQRVQNGVVYDEDQYSQDFDQIYNTDYYPDAYNTVNQNGIVYNENDYTEAEQSDNDYTEAEQSDNDYTEGEQSDNDYTEAEQNENDYSEVDYNFIDKNKVVYNDGQYNQAEQDEVVYNDDQCRQYNNQNKVVYNTDYNEAAYNSANQNEFVYDEVDQNDAFYKEVDYIPVKYKKVKYLPLNYKNVDYSGAQYSDF